MDRNLQIVRNQINQMMDHDQSFKNPKDRIEWQNKIVWPFIQKNKHHILSDKGENGDGAWPSSPYAAQLLVRHMDAYPDRQKQFYNNLKNYVPNHPELNSFKDRVDVNHEIMRQWKSDPSKWIDKNGNSLTNPTVDVRDPSKFNDANLEMYKPSSANDALQNAIKENNHLLASSVSNLGVTTQPSFNPSFGSNNTVIRKEDGGGITAYQGGPHRVGEEGYDNSKIGTGEGAAAYGHGHYFAEAEPIAKHYRDALTRGAGNMTIDGEPFHQHYTSTDPEKRLKAKLAIAMMHGDRDIHSAIDWHRQQVMGKLSSRNLMEEDIPEYMEDLKRLKSYEENPPIIEKNKGHMHEVAIHAHPDQFLDWDRPISEQHETIRRLVGITPEYEMAHKTAQKKDTDSLLAALEGNEQYIPTRMPTRPRGSLPMDAKGEDVYRHLQEKMGSIDWPVDADRETREQYRKSASERASQHLLAHGIKGIRYLDANSRGETDQPTHNYVVFDPKDIEIKRRYAEGGRVAYQKGGKVEGAIWHEKDVYGVAHGGSIAKTLQPVHNPAIVEHVLNKVGAALPALDPSLMAAKAGRRY